MTQAVGQLFCGECGKPVGTKFCTSCGTAAPAEPMAAFQHAFTAPGNEPLAPKTAPFDKSSLGVIVEEMIGADSNSFLSVLARFAVAPVKTIIRLTNDPNYNRQWSFMVGCIGISLTTMIVILPKLSHTPAPNGKGELLVANFESLFCFFVMTPIQYYACRAAGGVARPLRDYFKICSLSVGYTSLVYLPMLFVAGIIMTIWAMLIGIDPLDFGRQHPAAYVLVPAASLLIPASIFIAISQKKFWGFGWAWAVSLTIALLLATQILGLGLDWVIHRTGLPAFLQNLWG